MHHFKYTGDRLHCESVDLAEVARLYGTPAYVYSASTIADNLARLQKALPGVDARVCYAVKANPNLAVLRLLAGLGAGFDIVSGGELRRVVAAGGDPGKCVFAGVGKSGEEIRLALELGVFALHVESLPELERVNRVAGQLGVRAPVAFRVNPDVDAHTHAKITTGKSENKFGVPLEKAEAACDAAAACRHIRLRGVQTHIGSQLTSPEPFVLAVEKLAPLVALLRKRHGIEYCSIGGGIGIPYKDALASGSPEWWAKNDFMTPEAYGAALAPELARLGVKILLEPGRFLVGNAGVLLSRVEYLKRGDARNFLIVDAGMNDLVRPAMYDSHHEIVPLLRDTTRPALTADVVGPVCESSDCFAKGRRLQELREGEFLALMSAGAYGASMSSRYNSRRLPAEILVRGAGFELVRERESPDDLFRGEKLPPWL
ncbi:MAG: diaminopimelate decarboxylase [Opitutaceae bacterium]|jgi:diaminopimelate decarboxylase|nr:diaminopimelate decarboxylase [Opitutaceae bacterium]